jgi:hypothetical protein
MIGRMLLYPFENPVPACTVKLMPLLFTPLANTTTLPVVAPEGTVVAMLPALQLVTLAAVPLNVTVPAPWLAPKFDPLIVTAVPTLPDDVERFVMLGAGTTVKLAPLLLVELTVTTTLPVVAPDGTAVEMLVLLQLDTLAVVPLNCTMLVPWLDPKFEPMMVTEAPTAPVVADRLLIAGLLDPPPVTAAPTI